MPDIYLNSSKRHTFGTYRVRTPRETLEWLEPRLAEFGISRLADLTWLDDVGIPTFQAVRPGTRSLSVSQGKGLTPELAMCSALMECIELMHAEHATAALRGIAKANLPFDTGYGLNELNLTSLHYDLDQVALDWVAGRWLVSQNATYIPFDYVSLDARATETTSPLIFRTSTNGLSSGNTEDEAILHGIFEVLERHQLYLARLKGDDLSSERRLDLDFLGTSNQDLISRFKRSGTRVTVNDCTDPTIGIPTAIARVWSPGFPLTMTGSGCHLDPEIAISRALTEAAQARITLIAGAREDLDPRVWDLLEDPGVYQPVNMENGERQLHQIVCAVQPGADLAADLKAVAGHVRDVLKTEPIVVPLFDKSDPNSIPIVRVIIPGTKFGGDA